MVLVIFPLHVSIFMWALAFQIAICIEDLSITIIFRFNIAVVLIIFSI